MYGIKRTTPIHLRNIYTDKPILTKSFSSSWTFMFRQYILFYIHIVLNFYGVLKRRFIARDECPEKYFMKDIGTDVPVVRCKDHVSFYKIFPKCRIETVYYFFPSTPPPPSNLV